MISFSKDTLNPLLLKKNLISIDNNFIDNLNETKKNLIIGENGAGKTRLLQTIEDFYREKIYQNAEDIILIPIFCTNLNIFSPETSSEGGIETNDVIEGTIWQNEPIEKILEINMQVLINLINKGIIMAPDDTMNKTFEKLNKNLKYLLNKELKISEKHNKRELTITRYKDKNLSYEPIMNEWNYLSPGERITLILLLLIQYLEQMKNLLGTKEIIILIDEPELHLHPKVLLKLLADNLLNYFSDKKKENININGHLFIASHSVFLIPYFNFEEHIYLKESLILRKNSNLYKYLYKDLIGLEKGEEDGGQNLFDFLSSAYNWDYYSFISECFKEPDTKDKIDAEDGQTIILLDKIINNKINEKGTISILDYGCGPVARVGQNIKANKKTETLQKRIKYYAFDKKKIQ